MGVLEELAAELGLTPTRLADWLKPQASEQAVPNYLTLDPVTGLVGANFTGFIHALGLRLNAFDALLNPPYPPPTTNAVRWTDSGGATVAVLAADFNDPGNRLSLDAQAPSAAQRSLVAASAFDDTGQIQARFTVAQNARGSPSFVLDTTAVSKKLFDGTGASDWLQLLSTQKLRVDHGTAQVSWAGGTPFTNAPTINHGLGVVPSRLLVTPDVGSTNWALGTFGQTNANFRVAGHTTDGTSPGAGTTASFHWLVLG